MENLAPYFKFNRRMRRKTFIIIMATYLAVGAVVSYVMVPSVISHAQNLKEAIQTAPMSYYVFALIITMAMIPFYAARFMDLAIPPYFAALFLFPVCFNLAQKSGIIVFSHGTFPYTLMNIIGLCNLLAQLFLI